MEDGLSATHRHLAPSGFPCVEAVWQRPGGVRGCTVLQCGSPSLEPGFGFLKLQVRTAMAKPSMSLLWASMPSHTKELYVKSQPVHVPEVTQSHQPKLVSMPSPFGERWAKQPQ